MPNHRNRANSYSGGRPANPNVVNNNVNNNNGQPRPEPVAIMKSYECCVPTGCCRGKEEPVYEADPGDAVRVVCNNDQCTISRWMHADCFHNWEQHVLAFLRSCGRARSWSEKQRLQNLWTKKGYDLAYKACDCQCSRGHLRKDMDYIPKTRNDDAKTTANKKAKKNKRKNEKPLPVLVKAGPNGTVGISNLVIAQTPQLGLSNSDHHRADVGNNNNIGSSNVVQMKPQLRVRTSSFSSTGSSPPSSAGTPPLTPGKKSTFEFFADSEQAAAGNIFRRRADFGAFKILPRYQQNPYHIKMEDEGPHGNDEIRCFVLSNLSTHQITSVNCVVCSMDLPVYDKYPLIDGTFFLSPERYNTDLQVLSDHRLQYLNAICMRCLEGHRDIRCGACRTPWNGRTLVLGTMYTYDIFAASPCCAYRLTCKNCRRQILDMGCAQFYSAYSRSSDCPHCHAADFHFIKPFFETFTLKQPIRK